MKTVSATEARSNVNSLLDAAAAGERVVIERNGKPMGVLVSLEEAERLKGVGLPTPADAPDADLE